MDKKSPLVTSENFSKLLLEAARQAVAHNDLNPPATSEPLPEKMSPDEYPLYNRDWE